MAARRADNFDLLEEVFAAELARRDDRPDLARWVERVAPDQAPVPWHLARLIALFERAMVERVFALVSMPPRHAKSTTVRRALAYATCRYPDRLNAFVTYASSYARTHSRAIRRLVVQQGGRVDAGAANLDNWRTPEDGGLSVTGRDGQLTGKGFGGLLVLDDLIKNRKEAESAHLREQLNQSFSDDIYTRSEPPHGSIIVIATRWHEDDPHGRLSRDGWGETWDEVIIPAVTTPDGVPTDEITDDCIALCPERGFDLAWARKALSRGKYGFWSLYQQHPRPRGGQMFKEPARYDRVGFSIDGWRLVMVLDPAATASTSSDYSAGGVLAIRGRGETQEARPIEAFRVQEPMPRVIERCASWQQQYGIPLWVEGVGGFAAMPSMIRALRPTMDVRTIPREFMKGGKLERATPLSVAWNDEGDATRPARIQVPTGAWWNGYIDVFRDFTGINDAHDDDVDWTAHAWNLGSRAEGNGDPRAGLPSSIPWGR